MNDEKKMTGTGGTVVDHPNKNLKLNLKNAGRHKLSPEERKDKFRLVRLNTDQMAQLKAMAQANSLAEAAIIRMALQHFFDDAEAVLKKK